MRKPKVKDIRWTKRFLQNRIVREDKEFFWATSTFLMGIHKKNKTVRLIYVPSIKYMEKEGFTARGILDCYYTMEILKKLGYTEMEADSMITNAVEEAPSFGESFFSYDDLKGTEYGDWADIQMLYTQLQGKRPTLTYEDITPTKYMRVG